MSTSLPHLAAVRVRSAVVAVSVGFLAATCGGNRTDHAAAAPTPGDTLRGVIAVTGAEPMTRVGLRTPSGSVVLEGTVAETLRRVDGVEVWVAGHREDAGPLRVDSFRVRGLGGLPAADGVLEAEGDAVILVTAEGERVSYHPAPAALRRLAGRRVWIAGEPGGRPQQWGVISDGEPTSDG